MQSLKKPFDLFTGEKNMGSCAPGDLPSEASTQVPAHKFVKGFNPRFHGGASFPFSIFSAKPSAEELSNLRSGAEPAVPIAKVGDVEILLRKAVRTLSSLDWLLATLKETTNMPNWDKDVLDALWANIQRTLSFTTDFTTGAVVTALVARREAFLKSCDSLKVPRRVHTWAALRPILSSGRPSLLGDTADGFRIASKEDREMAIVSSLSSNRGSSSRYSNRPKSSSKVASAVSKPTSSQSASSSSGRPSRGRQQYQQKSRNSNYSSKRR